MAYIDLTFHIPMYLHIYTMSWFAACLIMQDRNRKSEGIAFSALSWDMSCHLLSIGIDEATMIR